MTKQKNVFGRQIMKCDCLKNGSMLLFIGFIFSCLSIIYAWYTYGVASIHSDIAAEVTAIQSIIDNESIFPLEWNYANGDINLMRTQVFFIIPYIFIRNKAVARMTGTLVLYTCVLFANILLCRRIFHNYSWVLFFPIFALFIGGVRSRDVNFYSGMYASIMVWIPIILVLTYDIYSCFSKSKIIVLGILLVLINIGGTRWLAEISAPLIFALIILACIETKYVDNNYHIKVKSCCCLLSTVVCSSSMGLAIYKYIGKKHNLNITENNELYLVDNIGNLGNNIIKSVRNMYACFGYYGGESVFSIRGITSLISICACSLICIIIPLCVLVRLNRSKFDRGQLFFLLFAYLHNAILLMTIITTGKIEEYHILSVVFVSILISSNVVFEYLSSMDNNLIKMGFSVLMLFSILCQASVLLRNGSDWREKQEKNHEVVESLIDHSVEKAYGSFWNSITWEVYSNEKIKMTGVKYSEQFISAYQWLTDNNGYNVIEDCRTALIFSEDENTEFGSRILEIMGPTIDDYVIEDVYIFDNSTYKWEMTDLHINVYDYDIAKNINNGVIDGVIGREELVFNWYGTKTAENITLNKGGILNGPFTKVISGDYLATIRGNHLNDLEYWAGSDVYNDAVEFEEKERSEDSIEIVIHSNRKVDDFHFFIINNSNDPIVFNQIQIEKL